MVLVKTKTIHLSEYRFSLLKQEDTYFLKYSYGCAAIKSLL